MVFYDTMPTMVLGCCDVLSMFVLSKWQHVALPTRRRPSVCALFYCYHTFLKHTTNISRKVCAPRNVSASGVPDNVQNCHYDKTNMDKTSQHLVLVTSEYHARFWPNYGRIPMVFGHSFVLVFYFGHGHVFVIFRAEFCHVCVMSGERLSTWVY